jgi:hypothetical protein
MIGSMIFPANRYPYQDVNPQWLIKHYLLAAPL